MSEFSDQVLGTVVLFALSGGLAVTLGLLLAAGAGARMRLLRLGATGVTTLTRGVPTSLLVIAGGVSALSQPPPAWLPNPYPGTSAGMALVAWAVMLGLALGSAGHLAVIFRTGYQSITPARREQLSVLGLGTAPRLALLARECAGATLAPTGARLVHHLHNTAFAALFPIADLLGWVQQRANATFEVERYVAIGVGTYVLLSFLIWATFRALEYWVTGRGTSRPARRIVEPA